VKRNGARVAPAVSANISFLWDEANSCERLLLLSFPRRTNLLTKKPQRKQTFCGSCLTLVFITFAETKQKMKILIIEDEYVLLKTIENFLLTEKYIVEKASDYYSAMENIMIYDYDCILLDISLPGGSGLQILQEMKKENRTGNIIIVSAKNSLEDKVQGLDLGADDYLTKPFHLPELHARIKAVLRRKQTDGKQILQLGNLSVDFARRQVFVENNLLKLNRKEFDMLAFFLTNKNRLITKDALAEHVWGDNSDMADNFDFVYSQVKNLRKKLHDGQSDIRIENIYGIGYKLTE
jgi:DNA-binding response OmpR family regulator